MADAWYAGGLRFECRMCGACCANYRDPAPCLIWVTPEDISAMAKLLGIDRGEFLRAYTRVIDGEGVTLTWGHEACVFLQQTDGQGKRLCAVYQARPLQCRLWPFWESNLLDGAAWSRAAAECRGIDSGPVVSAEEIDLRRRQSGEWRRE